MRQIEGGRAATAADIDNAVTGRNFGRGHCRLAQGSEHAVLALHERRPTIGGGAIPEFNLPGVGAARLEARHHELSYG
jgi:hypothetical protein